MRTHTLMGRLCLTAVLIAAVASTACLLAQNQPAGTALPAWQAQFQKLLPLYGHRNWICIVDSAYPLQCRAGIDTIESGQSQLDVLKWVLGQLDEAKHVAPVIYLDKELPFVPESECPGIHAYRRDLKALLGKRKVNSQLHDDTIKMLDEAAKTFNVLIIKTNMTLPYTSVFLRLDCGYWTPAQELQMRAAMKKAGAGK